MPAPRLQSLTAALLLTAAAGIAQRAGAQHLPGATASAPSATAPGTPNQIAPAGASCSGWATGGGGVTDRVQIDHIREQCGGPERLAAVVVWRGDAWWKASPLLDTTVVSAMQGRWRALAGDDFYEARTGLFTSRFFQGAVWDARTRRLTVMYGDLSRADTLGVYPLRASDSVVVVLVDRPEGAEGAPKVFGVTRLAPSAAAGIVPTDEELMLVNRGGPWPASMDGRALQRLIAASPIVEEFLRGAGLVTR